MTDDKRTAWSDEPVHAFAVWLASATSGAGFPYSPSSQDVYLVAWRRFMAFLRPRGRTATNASSIDVEAFLETLTGRRGDRAERETARRYLKVLSLAYRAMQADGAVRESPVEPQCFRRRPQGPRKLPHAMSGAQERAFLQAMADSEPEHWKRMRDRAMIFATLGAGLGSREVLTLPISAICLDDQPPFIRVAAYGVRRERVTPISPFARQELAQWLKLRESMPIAGDLAFPGNLAGDRLAASTFYRRVCKALSTAGIEQPHLGPQLLRNTFVVRQLAHDKPLAVVSDWVGHELVESTAVFKRLIVNPGGVEVA